MPVSEETYRQVALEDPDGHWELDCGRLRRKPDMTFEHNQAAWVLGNWLQAHLGWDDWVVRVNAGRVRRSASQYYIPDVMVIHMATARLLFPDPGALEVYPEPLPLVIEVWSPSTGAYDVEEKLKEYQRRGDLEVWRIHPYERTLTAWQRQADGGYAEVLHRGGRVRPVALPGVEIDLDELFALLRPRGTPPA